MKYKFKNGGVVKLQNVWTTIPTFENAFNRAFVKQNIIRKAEQKAKEQVASEKPKYTFVNPYDITRGWREATEDAAKQDKYIVQNLGGSEEETQNAYDNTWKNSRKQLATTTGIGLGTIGLLGASFGAFGPLTADIVNTGFTGASAYNLASNNGIRKTIRLMNERNYPRAFRSLAGDLIDLSAITNTGKLINRLGSSIKQGASIGNAYRSDITARMLQNAKLQGGWHPLGEDLYINSIDKTPSTYYTNDPVPITSQQFGRIIYHNPKIEDFTNTFFWGQKNIKSLPGPHLQSTLQGAPIEKLIAPDGTIHINQLRKYFQNASSSDKEIVSDVLKEFSDDTRLDYNVFRQAVQKSIGDLTHKYTYKYADYGLPRIGQDKVNKQISDGNGNLMDIPINPRSTQAKTILFVDESGKYGVGSNKHFDERPHGHIRSMVTVEEPDVFHILESQSDKYQHFIPNPKVQEVHMPFRDGFGNDPEAYTGIVFDENLVKYRPAKIGETSLKVKEIPDWQQIGENYDLWTLTAPSSPQEIGLSKFWEERQLIEAIKEAVKGGQTKIRFPIDETAAKIEGYGQKIGPVSLDWTGIDEPILLNAARLRRKELDKYKLLHEEAKGIYDKYNWGPEAKFHINQDYLDFAKEMEKKYWKEGRKAEFEDVLQHYRLFPKRLKAIGINDYKIVKDPKGIEWYEFNIPQSFLNGSAEYRAFKQGGILKGQQGIPYLNTPPSPKDSTFKFKPIQGIEKPKIEQKPIKTTPKFKQFINNVKFNVNKTDRPKAIGAYSFAYKQPTKVVENGGNMS